MGAPRREKDDERERTAEIDCTTCVLVLTDRRRVLRTQPVYRDDIATATSRIFCAERHKMRW